MTAHSILGGHIYRSKTCGVLASPRFNDSGNEKPVPAGLAALAVEPPPPIDRVAVPAIERSGISRRSTSCHAAGVRISPPIR